VTREPHKKLSTIPAKGGDMSNINNFWLSQSEISFAVLDFGIGFFGIGRDRSAAIRNAAKWLPGEPDIRSIPDYSESTCRGSLCVCRITPQLALEIERRGGGAPVYVPYRVNVDGVFDLTEKPLTDKPQESIPVSAKIYDRGNA
jgi:hypothetical protein